MRPLVCVRMEAIGGQGANSAGKILAEAAVIGLKYTGCHFASFGSEKRGSPVQSFVKLSPERTQIRSAFFSEAPDLIIIFHEAMIELHAESLKGAGPSTDLVINSEKSPEDISLPKGINLRSVSTLNAGQLARQNKCGINMVMLGAALNLLPELTRDSLAEAVKSFFHRLSPQTVVRNLEGLDAGRESLKTRNFDRDRALLATGRNPLPQLGWQNAPIGGLIANPGNSVLKDNSLSRNGLVPRLISDLCVNCGFCDMVCPDYCFVWENNSGQAKLKGIDYQYCKACQKCVEVCPAQALQQVEENEIPESEKIKKFNISFESIESQWKNVDLVVKYPDEPK